MDSATVQTLALAVGAPLWITVLIFALRTAKVWPEIAARFNERFRDRAKITADDWERFREEIRRLSALCVELYAKVHECEEDRAHWMGRAIKAEAVLDGHGEVRQAAANAAAEVRADPAKAPTAARRFGLDKEGQE